MGQLEVIEEAILSKVSKLNDLVGLVKKKQNQSIKFSPEKKKNGFIKKINKFITFVIVTQQYPTD